MSRYFADASTALLAPIAASPRTLSMLLETFDAAADELQEPIRHVHRDRDAGFGIGYGNSSGYGTDRRYVADRGPQRFRFT
jgi:hypothetical protein